MNIYDFDNTIFKGDSSSKFIKYSLVRHPIKVLKCLFKVIPLYLKNSEFDIIKSELFSFVKYIDNFDDYMDKFINKNLKYIKKFYLDNQKDNDLIISASFDFIIERFCNKLNIKNVISSKYDIKNGCIIGKNCKGIEKVKEFNKLYKGNIVNNAYSDSLSDIPMLKLANNAYLVKNNKIIKLDLHK